MKKALVLAVALAGVFAFTGCAAGYDSTTDGYGYDNYYNGYGYNRNYNNNYNNNNNNRNNFSRDGYASPYKNGTTYYNGTTYNNGVTNPMYNK